MLIFLPKQVDGLEKFEKTLTPTTLSEWVAKLSEKKVRLTVPKFKVTEEYRLAAILSEMGMKHTFTPSVADFSGMNGKKDLFMSEVVHKAFIDVDEEGTEAAAATAVVTRGLAVEVPAVFRADHPFLFLIQHTRSGSILFLGRLMNPQP